jgi:hypothetical protein
MILTIVTLAALYFALAFCVERNRGRNLDIIACDYRGQLIEALAQLDDSQRNAAYWQERTDKLIDENYTLGIDLYRTETEAQYLRGFVRRQKDTTAGVVLLYGAPNAKRQLHVAEASLMP